MPQMGGFEATGAIRAKERGAGKRIPVVALTAHAMKGMDDYVSKPIRAAELLDSIGRLAEEIGRV